MPWSTDGRYWVGRNVKHGIIVVPRDSIGGEFNVYFPESDRFALCDRKTMRAHTSGKNVSPSEILSAIERIETYGDRKLERKNRLFLQMLGKKFAGTRKRDMSLPLRSTHCYSCKSGIDSSTDLECVRCGWILCSCGACGCGYEKN